MWQLTAAAHGVVLVAYALVSAAILRGLVRPRQVRANALGTATAAVFLTGAVHHGSYALDVLARHEPAGWAPAAWGVLAAAAALCYWSLRRSYGRLMPADLKARRRDALEINDNIVQGLAVAQYRYESGDPEAAHEAVVATLAKARRMMSDLVDPTATRGLAIAPGDLVRSVPAQPVSSPDERTSVGT